MARKASAHDCHGLVSAAFAYLAEVERQARERGEAKKAPYLYRRVAMLTDLLKEISPHLDAEGVLLAIAVLLLWRDEETSATRTKRGASTA